MGEENVTVMKFYKALRPANVSRAFENRDIKPIEMCRNCAGRGLNIG